MYNKKYKASSIFDNPTVENYLDGVRINGKGIKEPLNTSINKYNKELIEEVNRLNTGFYKLVRANTVLIKIIEKHHGNIPELRNIYNIIHGQSGTIKYNRSFKRALRTYGITHKDVYQALLSDIEKQKDRLKRNAQISKMLLDELGLNEVYKAVEDTTSMKFEDYIEYLEANNPIEKPSYLDEEAEKKYYEDLTNYQFGAVIGIIDSHKVNVECTIKESLINNRNRLNKLNDKSAYIDIDIIANAKQKLNADSCNIQRDIGTDYHEYLCKLTKNEADNLAYTIEKTGKEVYYVSMVRTKGGSLSEIGYCDNNYKITFNVLSMKLFINKQEAECAVEKLQQKYSVQGFMLVTAINKLMGTQDRSDKLDVSFYESHLDTVKNLEDAKRLYDKTEPGLAKFKLGQRIKDLEFALRATQAQEILCEAQQKAKEKYKTRTQYNNRTLYDNSLNPILYKVDKVLSSLKWIVGRNLDQYTIIDELDSHEVEELECDSQDFANFYSQSMRIDKQVRDSLSKCDDTFLNDSLDSYKQKGRKSIFIVSVLKDGKLKYFDNGMLSGRIYKKLTDDVSSATIAVTRKEAIDKRDRILRSLYGSKMDRLDYPLEPIVRVTEIKLQGEEDEYSTIS